MNISDVTSVSQITNGCVHVCRHSLLECQYPHCWFCSVCSLCFVHNKWVKTWRSHFTNSQISQSVVGSCTAAITRVHHSKLEEAGPVRRSPDEQAGPVRRSPDEKACPVRRSPDERGTSASATELSRKTHPCLKCRYYNRWSNTNNKYKCSDIL